MFSAELTPSFWRSNALTALREQLMQSFNAHLSPFADSDEVDFNSMLANLHNDGLSGLRYEKNNGGTGHGLAAQAMFAECLGTVPSGGIGMGLTIHLDMVAPFVDQQGTLQQIEAYLKPALRGDIIFSHAVSEPNAGSDISNIQTSAVRDGTGWRVNGVKSMIALASLANVHFVVAHLPHNKPPFNMINFLIPNNTPGISVSKVAPTLGNTSCPIANITFDNVWVDDCHRLGTAGMGMIYQMQQFSQERILSSLRANEVARACLQHVEACMDTPTSAHTDARFKADQLWQRLAASKAITYKAMGEWIGNGNYHTLSCSSKLLSSRLVREASTLALSATHETGHKEKLQTIRCLNDARLYSISTGSDEMMLKSIAASEKY